MTWHSKCTKTKIWHISYANLTLTKSWLQKYNNKEEVEQLVT